MNDTTREKILEISHKLFADKGFNGVSVREIAAACDVNIAAINYHFNNKANLYAQTIVQSIQHTNQRIKHIFESSDNTDAEIFAIEVFRHFMENSEDLRTSFRLIMTSDEKMEAMGEELQKFNGPPGGEYFYQCLRADFPKTSDQDLQWGVRCIFTQIVHKAIVMCNSNVCSSMEEIGMGLDVMESDIRRLVKVIKKELS